MGKATATQSDISLRNLIKFLRYPETARSSDRSKSEYFKEDFENSIKNSGISVDTSNSLLKYWYKHVDDIPEEALPEEWDWRDIDGVNYLNPPRMQVRKFAYL